MLKNCSLLLLLACSLNIYSVDKIAAQAKNPVSGIVISKKENEPIIRATISWKNKGIGSITNEDGKFTILLPTPYSLTDSLTFSCIGYDNKKIRIDSAILNRNIVIKLNKSIEVLKEVIIKPLNLKQLLDSITRHNTNVFVSPMVLNGYYREFVYTNSKCTEYADALCGYFFDRLSKPDGQLKINASRCLEEKQTNKDWNNAEIYSDSKIDPNIAFKYAMLSAMIEKYFPDKALAKYSYDIDQSTNSNSGDLKITIFPKLKSGEELYKLTLFLKDDCTLKTYHLEIPENILMQRKEKSLLGIHVKTIKYSIDVNYSSILNRIYPNYYTIAKNHHVWGKFLGAKFDQIVEDKSEFVVTELNKANDLKAFEKQQVYKKGNICNNGAAINDALLKNYTVIRQTAKDSTSINSLQPQ